jgi:2-polyprenyl-6-methoxyphenol hydroxylase-like FAD-dependent oxidoreductase
MARIVMIGGGAVGLTTALLLGRDGHDVTLLERDPAVPPPPDTAWDTWERRGVNQFRLLHFILAGYRERMDVNAPDVVQALRDAGAASINPLRDAPDFVTGGFRDGDEPASSRGAPTSRCAAASPWRACSAASPAATGSRT